jgi:hypothetical protein
MKNLDRKKRKNEKLKISKKQGIISLFKMIKALKIIS